MEKGVHSFNRCFLHGDYAGGGRCPHPEHHAEQDGMPPREWWRNVPCGHPPDPIAWQLPDGSYTCHCGWTLVDEDAPGPIVPCDKCGCHVALPAVPEVPARS